MIKALVVGEESEERTQVMTTLTNDAFAIEVADAGEDALEKISSAPDDHQLVVIYDALPDISAFDLILLIRKSRRFGRVGIILIAPAEQPWEEADRYTMFAYGAGADMCLSFLYPEELLMFSRHIIESQNPPPPRCFECNKLLLRFLSCTNT